MDLFVRLENGRQLSMEARPGEKLSQAIWLSGKLPPQPLCDGLGLCGRCRCRFIDAPPQPTQEDLQKLSAAELEAGWRLACHHHMPACGHLNLELPCAGQEQELVKLRTNTEKASLGIDFGTTTIHWQAVKNGEPQTVLIRGQLPNPQTGAGPDVISRLAYALQPGGEARLSRLGLEAIGRITDQMAEAGLAPVCACVAANSAMTEILLQKDIQGLASAPWRLSYHGNEIVELELPGASPALRTSIPPLPAPFVGGDLVAGILGLAGKKRPFLLADLGTNAELAVLNRQDRLYLTSAPLGPALEGIGPACGQPAGPGVITGFALTPAGITTSAETPEKGIQGISATGYISLLALLLRLGLMDASGQISLKNAMPLVLRSFRQAKDGRLELPCGQYLMAADVELLLKARAAFRVAFDLLLHFAKLPASELEAVYLAGALGEYARLEDLAVLGFIPPSLARKTIVCGNASLAGACLLAANPEKLAEAEKLCANAQILQLAESDDFLERYIASMRWGAA